jgi:hypothetical protein
MTNDLAQLTTDALRSNLKAAQAIERTVLGIFVVIVLAWIVLGYWRKNVAMFLGTLSLACGAWAIVSVGPRRLRAELARRESAA